MNMIQFQEEFEDFITRATVGLPDDQLSGLFAYIRCFLADIEAHEVRAADAASTAE
jgi:hypothetical protein